MRILKDKNIVVFGGSKGIGCSIASACAEQGANVFIASRSASNLEEARDILLRDNKAEVKTFVCDVTSNEDVANVYDQIESQFGPVYGVVCSSGVYGPIGPIDKNSIEEWAKCIDVNLVGTARCVNLILDKMKKRREGRFIFMSGGGQAGLSNFSAYTASKGGIWRLTETLGGELAPHNIFVNAIAPGAVNTQLLKRVLDAGAGNVGVKFYEQSLKQKEFGGIPPKKAADCAVYLLSNKSEGLYGKILSAVWDAYQDFTDLNSLSQSDIFTMKRVVENDGGTRFRK